MVVFYWWQLRTWERREVPTQHKPISQRRHRIRNDAINNVHWFSDTEPP